MPNIIYNNLPFPSDDLEDTARNLALGRFLTAWSQIEGVCGFLFRQIASLDYAIAQTIFDRVGTREQISILKGLVDTIEDVEARQRLEVLMGRVDKFAEKRNKIAHAGWGQLNGESARFWQSLTTANIQDIARETDKGKSLRDKNIHTLSDLERIINECVAVREELETELASLSNERGWRSPAWLRTPHGPTG